MAREPLDRAVVDDPDCGGCGAAGRIGVQRSTPTPVNVNVSLVITVAAGGTKAQVAGGVGNAIGSYINGLPIGASPPLTRLHRLPDAADATVINVTQLSANGNAKTLRRTRRCGEGRHHCGELT